MIVRFFERSIGNIVAFAICVGLMTLPLLLLVSRHFR